jgi:2-(1,2-epoxy-1,2-dihydrophenyl)acetyl-CoA isomerase
MEPIVFDTAEGIGSIRLNRPEKFNAFNREMSLMLQATLDECAAEKKIRAVYITGNGKAFSAGQDLSELSKPDMPGFDRLLAEHYNPIITRIRNMEKPVVCAVNGVAAGAGANIALCCDIVVAAQSATFIQAFSKIGLIPDSGGTFFLPRLIGWQKALAIALLGDKVTAAEAAQMGMIYKFFPDDIFPAQAFTLAKTLAGMATRGLALTKKAFNFSLSNSLPSQLKVEDQLQQEAASTRDYREGISAFLEKRPPQFQGE